MSSLVPGIVRKVNWVSGSKHLHNLLAGYLDETTKHGYLSPSEAMSIFGAGDYAQAIADKRAPLRPGQDYVPTSGSHVHVYGFVRQELSHQFPSLDGAPEKDVIAAVEAWWLQNTRRRKRIAAHVVFSLHPKIAEQLNAAGIAVDPVLLNNTTRALEVYAARFHPGDTLGMVCGIHHDRQHPHLHALIFPKTSSGRRVCLSRLCQLATPDGEVRVDYQGMLLRAYVDNCNRTVEHLERKPVQDFAEAAGDMATSIIAMSLHNNKAPGTKPTAAEFKACKDEAERLGQDRVADLWKGLAADQKKPDVPQAVGNLRSQIADLRKGIKDRSARIRGAAADVFSARSKAVAGLYRFGAIGPGAGYDRQVEERVAALGKDPAERLPKLEASMKAETGAYRSAVHTFNANTKATDPLSGTLSRVNRTVATASILVSRVTGQKPFFFEPGQDGQLPIRIVPAEERAQRLRETLADILKRNAYDMRPFTVAEFGNKDLSPFRRTDAFDKTVDAEDEPQSEAEILENFRILKERAMKIDAQESAAVHQSLSF